MDTSPQIERIHSTALVDKRAQLGSGVDIGPYCVVGPNVILDDGVRLISHVVVDGCTKIGARTILHPFSSLRLGPFAFLTHLPAGPNPPCFSNLLQ